MYQVKIAALFAAVIVLVCCLPPNGETPDRTVPTVVSVAPAHGSASVATDAVVEVTFSEAMERTATEAALSLVASAPVAGSFAWTRSDTVLTFTPANPLQAACTHTVTVAATAADLAGNALGTSFVATFVTCVPPLSFTGSVSINGGAALTNSLDVSISVITDGATEMRFGATASAVAVAPWEPIGVSKAWTLGDGEGSKTVYAELRKGSEVLPLSAAIYYNVFTSPVPVAGRKLLASDAAANDNFGYAVAVSADGGTVVATTIKKDLNAVADQGQAYIFRRSGSAWTEVQALNEVGTLPTEYYGRSVAISDDGSLVVIGAMYKDASGAPATTNGKGAAYVYRRSVDTWVFEQKLSASDAAAGDRFGISVAVSGDGGTIVVGAAEKTVNVNAAQGQAYIYRRSGAAWAQVTPILVASDGAASARFGISVSTNSNGSVVAVGSQVSTGEGYIYTESSGWSETKVLPPAGGYSAYQALSLSRSGDVLAVGSYLGDTQKGAVYVFTKSGGTWSHAIDLLGSAVDAETYLWFGYSVSLSGDGSTLAVGAIGQNGGSTSGQGAAYVFNRSGAATWSLKQSVTAQDRAAGDCFGSSVALAADGSILAAGAYLDSTVTGSDYKGSVYISD